MSVRRPFAALVAGLWFALALVPAARAIGPGEALPDPALEARARSLSAQMRCLVCQNQSIDDSDAPIAKDLRLLIRDRIKGGDTDAQVESYLVDRYGEFILLKPRFAWHTLALWLAPFAALLFGALLIWRGNRGGATVAAVPVGALTEAEQKALDRLLRDEAGGKG